MVAVVTERLADELVQLAAQGLSLRQAGLRLGLRPWRPYRLVDGCRVKPRLTDEAKRRVSELLQRGDLSLAAIARETGVSKSSVLRIRDGGARGRDGELRRTRRAYRCPCCDRLVQISPCVACAASAARS